jgi:hypothetical protein
MPHCQGAAAELTESREKVRLASEWGNAEGRAQSDDRKRHEFLVRGEPRSLAERSRSQGDRTEGDGPEDDETHALVNGDGTGVVFADMQKGFQACGSVILQQAIH